MSERAVRWIVKGRVQGVGYRYFTERAASRLGLRGTVRNRSDGTVEVHACGPSDSLDALRARLLEGPRWGEVDEIEDLGASPEPMPDGFEVRF